MKRTTKELVNMLSAALLVLATLLLALGVHACRHSDTLRQGQAQTLREGGVPETEIHILTLCGTAALPLPSTSFPLARERLEKVKSTLTVLAPELDGEEPVFSASPGLFVSPLILSPLCDLATAFSLARPGESLSVVAAFSPDVTSPFSTGCAVSLAVRCTEGTLPLTSVPDAAACLAAERARHGFIAFSDDPSALCYVGYPHAYLMEERHLTPSQYLTYLSLFSQSEPLTARVLGGTYRVFYLPAEDGHASLILPRDTPFSATPVGSAGFLITLPGDV